MNSIHPNGSVTSDCCYCDWESEPQHCIHDAMVKAGEHMRECEARATYYAEIRSGVRS